MVPYCTRGVSGIREEQSSREAGNGCLVLLGPWKINPFLLVHKVALK